jgi:hypothetical protein
VVTSKIKLGWKPNLDHYLLQRELVEDYLEPFEKEMRSATTDFERHVFSWCVETFVPLKQLQRGEIHLTYYENLCEDPKGEAERLFAFLGKAFDESVFEKMKNPSPLCREGSAILSGERLTDSWRRDVTGPQLERAVEILGLFGLDKIYSEKVRPDPSGELALMRTDGYARALPERESRTLRL